MYQILDENNKVQPAHVIGKNEHGADLIDLPSNSEPLFPHFLDEDGNAVALDEAYAVYLPNGPIYGYGCDEESAWQEADKWIETRDGLEVKECSLELYAEIVRWGGAIQYNDNDILESHE